MKRYRVTVDGRIYDVEIDDPDARPVTARLSGFAFSVDVEPARPEEPTPADEAPAPAPTPAAPPVDPLAAEGDAPAVAGP